MKKIINKIKQLGKTIDYNLSFLKVLNSPFRGLKLKWYHFVVFWLPGVMLLLTGIFMPSGLGIYWVTSNVFTIVQNIIVIIKNNK